MLASHIDYEIFFNIPRSSYNKNTVMLVNVIHNVKQEIKQYTCNRLITKWNSKISYKHRCISFLFYYFQIFNAILNIYISK